MKKLFIVLLIVFPLSAQAATAFWTGKSEQVRSVTGQIVWNCQYQYAGNYFWRAFASFCPSSVEVY